MTQEEAFAIIDREDWIPEENRQKLKEMILAWPDASILIILPPGPGRVGYTIHQKMMRH